MANSSKPPSEAGDTPAYRVPFPEMLGRVGRSTRPFSDHHGIMPPADLDLDAVLRRVVQAPAMPPPVPPRDLSDKRAELALEFAGQSELFLEHALLIAVLRRVKPPPYAAGLFSRFWSEKGDVLAQLSSRWLVSAATTFADHGHPDQRAAGLSLMTLFAAIQLYETERLYSGHEPERPFGFSQQVKGALPMNLPRYHLPMGDLDLNLLGRLWREGDRDPATRALATAMLNRLNAGPSVFRRLLAMRRILAERDSTKRTREV